MVERVVLHIGTMKSGTTYLQRVLESGVLEGVGGYYAGGSFRVQSMAVEGVARTPKLRTKKWDQLAKRVQSKDGTAFYSQEFLSFARPAGVRHIVESFGGAPVEVVLTVRDQRRAVPAQWQSFVRSRGLNGWEDYLRLLGRGQRGVLGRGGRTKAVRGFRRTQGIPGMVERWAGQPGVSRFSLVLVPPPGSPPELLWERFCEAAGIRVEQPPHADALHNESLGYASCELLARLNGAIGTDLSYTEYERARRAPVAALLPLRPEEERPVLDEAGTALACELNRRIREAAARDDVRVVGSLDELPEEDDGTAATSIPPPDQGQLQHALDTAWAACAPGVAMPAGGFDAAVTDLGRRLARRFGP